MKQSKILQHKNVKKKGYVLTVNYIFVLDKFNDFKFHVITNSSKIYAIFYCFTNV